MYLGVKAVLAKSFERIHSANLVNFGIIPLTFKNAADYAKIAQGDAVSAENWREAVRAGKPVMRVKKGAKPVFYALRDIAEGEELFIDYATFEYKTKVLANIKCLCGAPNCRGHITGFVGLSPEQVKDYSDCLADYLKEKKPAK